MPQQQLIEMPWPSGGLVENAPEAAQPPNTTPDALNVRNFDSLERRNRGGQRTGISKHVPLAVNGSNAVQMLRTQVESVALSVDAGFGSKYADPVVLPPATAGASARGVVIHPDGDRVVVVSRGSTTTLHILTYEWSDITGWGTQIQDSTIAGFTDGAIERLEFSPDGAYLMLILGPASTTQGVWPFAKATGVGTMVSFPSTSGIGSNTGWDDAVWHPDGDQILVSYPAITTLRMSVRAYGWSGGAFGASINSFTHASSTPSTPHLAIAPDGSGVVFGGTSNLSTLAYDKVTGFSGVVDTADAGGGVVHIRFHPDSTHVVYTKSSVIRVRTFSSVTGLGASIEQTLAGATSGPALFSPTGDFILAPHNTTPFISVFPWTGAFGSAVPNPSTLPPDNGNWADWSPSEEAIAEAHFDSPFVTGWPFHPAAVNPNARRQRIIAVSGGNVYLSSLNLGSWSLVNGGSGALISSGDVMGQEAFQSTYFADSTSDYKVFRYSSNSVVAWTPTVGTLPAGTADTTIGCRIITLYRGRVVLSGLLEEPQNWFMSASGDPLDWDYSPAATSPTMAVAGNSSTVGEMGDVVTALCPHQDDVMVMGGANSIWIMRGDPAAGGAIDNLTRQVGIAGKEAWTWDTSNNLYFFGESGFYRLNPGGAEPELISKGRLDKTFANLDLSSTQIRLVYDAVWQGVHIFVTPTPQPASPVDHYFWDERTNSFWRDQYPTAFGPTAVHRFVSDNPENSAVLLGGWDSYVRAFDDSVNQDDGTSMTSYVLFSPIQLGRAFASSRLDDLHVVTAEGSGAVALKLFAGDTVEEARDQANANTPRITRTLVAGRNNPLRQRLAQNAIILRLGLNANATWAFEQAGCKASVLNRMYGKRVS